MAIGDDATAAGFDLVAGTDDRRDGWQEINLTRDYAAQVKAASAPVVHTHDDRYYTETETSAAIAAAVAGVDLSSKANAYGNVNDVRYAEGPTGASYSRSASGSSWYAVWMNSSLQFMRNTSSRRYKNREQPFSIDFRRILAMVPTTYHRKGQPEDTRELGLIAEDLVTLPHIVSWDVPRNQAGEPTPAGKPRPEAVRYEQVLPVMLLHVCREQQAMIDALTERLDAMTPAPKEQQ